MTTTCDCDSGTCPCESCRLDETHFLGSTLMRLLRLRDLMAEYMDDVEGRTHNNGGEELASDLVWAELLRIGLDETEQCIDRIYTRLCVGPDALEPDHEACAMCERSGCAICV